MLDLIKTMESPQVRAVSNKPNMACSKVQGKRFIYWALLPITLFFAFTVRVAVRWCTGEQNFWENGYTFFLALAQHITAENGISTIGSLRVPLYPMFLAAVTIGEQPFISVVLVQSLIGTGTVLCAALIARELFGNTAAVIAAILVAIYPYYVVHDTALQETSLYTFLTV